MQKQQLLIAGAVGVLGFGCSDPAQTSTGGLQQGLTIFTATPETGVAGAYAKGELAVFFETTIREVESEPAPQHDQFALDGTAVNVSARFTDMEGRNLLVSLATHEPPEAWHLPGEMSEAMRAARPALFALALETGQAIEAANLGDHLGPELHTLVITGVKMQPPVVTVPAVDRDTYYSDGYDHWQYFEVHSKSCCGVAEHSATVFWNWSPGYGWEDGWQTSNHGTWAMEMGLEEDCGGSGAWAGGDREHYYADRLQTCDMKNGYAVCGPFGGNHNCHDDSKFQRKNILEGYLGGAPSFCSGWGCDMYAPGCY